MEEGAQVSGGSLPGKNPGPFRPGMASIVTRTRSRPVFLARAVEGVLAQSYENWEHIIVNDGGDAGTVEKLLTPFAERYAGRLKLIHLPRQCGMQVAANTALAQACGEFVTIHDDDDDWHPDYLAATVNFLAEKGPESPYRGVVTQTVRVWEDVDAAGRIAEVSREPYQPLAEVNLFRVGYENPFPPVAFLYRRAVHEEIGLFNPAYSYAADLDFNLRFLARWEIGVIPRPLAYYHWRRSAGETAFHNTVTAESDVHGRLLNEWLNAALRSESGGDPARLGLAMNLARYAVGTRTGIDALLEKNREELERLGDLKSHLSSLSGAFSGEALARLADLKAHLSSLSWNVEENAKAAQALCAQIGEGIGGLKTTLSGETAARLEDLKAHLSSLSDALSGEALARLADLKTHLAGLSQTADRTERALAGRGDDLKNHLSSLTDMMGGDAIPKIGSLAEKLEALVRSVGETRRELAASEAGMTDRLARLEANSANPELHAKLEDMRRLLASLSDALSCEAVARLNDLKIRLTGLTDHAGRVDSSLAGIAESLTGGVEHLSEIGERLDRFAGIFATGALPRLEELRTQLAAASANLTSQYARLAAVGEAAAQIARNSEETLALLAEIRSLAAEIVAEQGRLARNSVTREDHEALRSEVGALRTELADWRRESVRREKYWRIGRLRIGWKSGE